jgi:hypothetical protein
MAGKATSVYVTVTTKDHKSVVHRKFINMSGANTWLKENEDKYPKTEYIIYKETY